MLLVVLAENLRLCGDRVMAEKSDSASRKKDRPGVIAPPPVIFLLFFLLGMGAEYLLPMTFPGAQARYVAGGLLIATAMGLAVWALPQFRRFRTHVDPYRPSKAIITTGPYRFTRNPLYVGLALLHAGVAVVIANVWALAAVVPALLMIRWGVVLREEAYLTAKFGEEYRSYKARVRRWL
jgi:protein-S-isoprenylcysteine O-methyltransferase Ste14